MDSYFLYGANADLSAPDAGGCFPADADEVPASSQPNLRLLFSDISAGPGTLDLSLLVKNLTDSDKMAQGIDFSMFRSANW